MWWWADLFGWVTTLLLLAVGLALAIVATGRSRHWFAVPTAAIVILVIGITMVRGLEEPHPVLALTVTVLLVGIGVIGGSPIVIGVLELAGSNKDELGEHGGIVVTGKTTKEPDREILRGGATIGYLERLFIIGAALLGQFAAVAIVVAIKGLGRFNELETPAARERFIIGTLASIVWAAACVAPLLIG